MLLLQQQSFRVFCGSFTPTDIPIELSKNVRGEMQKRKRNMYNYVVAA